MCKNAQSPVPASPKPAYNPRPDEDCELHDAQRLGSPLGPIPVAPNFTDCSSGDAPLPPPGGLGEDGHWKCYDVYLNEWASYDGGYTWYLEDSIWLGAECWLYSTRYIQ